MQFTLGLTSVLAVAAAAMPSVRLEARATDLSSQVLANLTVVRTDIAKLNNTVLTQKAGANKYTNDQLVALVNANNKLASDINSTSKTANASATFTSAESGTIYTRINGTLKPEIFNLLDSFNSHYPNFKAQGVQSVVSDQLKSQRELTRQLGNSLTKKGTSDYTTKSNQLRDQILAKFDGVIKTYSA